VRRFPVGLAAAAALLVGESAAAMFKDRPEAPVKRLLANVARELAKSPDDPHLLYLAGRTHAVAYAMGDEATAHAKQPDKGDRGDESAWLPTFGTRNYDLLRFRGDPDDARLVHLQEGIRLLRRAAGLTASNESAKSSSDERPLLHLELAWLLDDGSRFAPRLGDPEGGKPPADVTEEERTRYAKAIHGLQLQSDDLRKSALDTLRAAMSRCWPQLVEAANDKDPAAREKAGDVLVRWWRDQALASYRQAFAFSRDADAKRDAMVSGEFAVSAESGKAILRLLDGAPDSDPVRAERKSVQEQLDRMDAIDGMAVTPVIFPVSGRTPLAELLRGERTTRFDVAGDGVARRWPWPSADAGFLVWTGDGARPVTSGRQLFGSRTWWIFWKDGYEPLAMLDDDGDGRLSGAELDGIGVWCDLNGDGVCQDGEVRSAADFGIAWIAVSATRREDGAPANDDGIGLADGTTRPSYDWTPRSLPEPSASRP
jgi:hypothetical protein